MKEYKVEYWKKPLGSEKTAAEQLTNLLNQYADKGWQVLSIQFDATLQNSAIVLERETPGSGVSDTCTVSHAWSTSHPAGRAYTDTVSTGTCTSSK